MRIHGWQEALAQVLQDCALTPFAYPSHDCCTFAAKCADAMTDGDFYARLTQKYSDEATAKAYIVAGGGLEAAVSQWIGPSLGPNAAGPGDVVLIEQANVGPTLGVCLGLNCALAKAPAGIQYVRREAIQRCWRIG